MQAAQMKSRLQAVLNSNLMIADQAAINARPGFDFRRYLGKAPRCFQK
jgi:hypothetical protein